MSVLRLLGTALGMSAIAACLTALAPSLAESVGALSVPQATVDAAGADVLVLHLVGLLAWLAWAWGALGLLLTAASALPGLAGDLAAGTVRRVLPAGARRAAAIALGIGLGIAPPALGVAAGAVDGTTTTQELARPTVRSAVPDWAASTVPERQPTHVPDWAAPAPAGVPDWPQVAAGEHVVVRGDCLWSIAERRLAAGTGSEPTSAEVAVAVRAWWQANADVIGPDPDLLLPGQVLRPPVLP
ncbi:LysM peptidoglycan-binding domain-containing protein [Blastococcus saxobsidens]|uniref:LysM peptidoglycan-binding domain-containing protein n=1 Tax=Blastococcus saxobsidens TaxID=138336 RepID=A0A6L9W0L1_9ACTN|nr:LysM domain-containing protein [Blastococcus saxobsidens]NEK85352.1 LysM peptidoglycan-binding domain-containing protein [Blastococcus saxobsidens]